MSLIWIYLYRNETVRYNETPKMKSRFPRDETSDHPEVRQSPMKIRRSVVDIVGKEKTMCNVFYPDRRRNYEFETLSSRIFRECDKLESSRPSSGELAQVGR